MIIHIENKESGYSNPEIETGKCWASDDSSSWWVLGSDTSQDKVDLCIRAYTTTPPDARPEVTTGTAKAIMDSTITVNGEITFLGGSEITQYGVCWSKSINPTIEDSKTTEGAITSTGVFC